MTARPSAPTDRATAASGSATASTNWSAGDERRRMVSEVASARSTAAFLVRREELRALPREAKHLRARYRRLTVKSLVTGEVAELAAAEKLGRTQAPQPAVEACLVAPGGCARIQWCSFAITRLKSSAGKVSRR